MTPEDYLKKIAAIIAQARGDLNEGDLEVLACLIREAGVELEMSLEDEE